MAVIFQDGVKRVTSDSEAKRLVASGHAQLVGYGNRMIKSNDYAIKKGIEDRKRQAIEEKKQIEEMEAKRQERIKKISDDAEASRMAALKLDRQKQSEDEKKRRDAELNIPADPKKD